MSRHNRYQDRTTDALISKIDSLIAKSRSTRNEIKAKYSSNMRGGTGPFVSLDTPKDGNMMGGAGPFVSLDTPKDGNMMGGSRFVSLDTPKDGNMMGGAGPFVSLDTPKDGNMMGGAGKFIDLDTPIMDVDKMNLGLDLANKAIEEFNMIGGDCGEKHPTTIMRGGGCGDDEFGACGNDMYNRVSNRNRNQSLNDTLKSLDQILKGF